MKALAPVVSLILVLLVLGGIRTEPNEGKLALDLQPIGRVVDSRGNPIPGAVVTSHGRTRQADADGRFGLDDRHALYRVSKSGYLPRVVAGQVGEPLWVPLVAEADAVSVRFGGDVMFGRPVDPRLPRGTAMAPAPAPKPGDLGKLLAQIAPVLADADVTVVNLETVSPRDHGSADQNTSSSETPPLVAASPPGSLNALKKSGIDAVDLANNRVSKALDAGMGPMLEAIDRAGLVRFGAGRNEAEAWNPGMVTVRGQQVYLIACTTVGTAQDSADSAAVVASCENQRLKEEIGKWAGHGGRVIAMLHGDGRSSAAEELRRFTTIAQGAGADVVVNGRPHVVGAASSSKTGAVVATPGSLLFNQSMWASQIGYLTRVDLQRSAQPVLSVDPLVFSDGVAYPAVGAVAEATLRMAAGLPGGSVRVSGSQAWGNVQDELRTRTKSVSGVHRLASGWSVMFARGVTLGVDRLYGTGGFERSTVNGSGQAALLWNLGQYARLGPDAACHGQSGALLLRSSVSRRDVGITISRRVKVVPGARLSLFVSVRSASSSARAELRWYRGARGPSTATTAVPVNVGGGDPCSMVRLDAVVPRGITAVAPFVRLLPPGGPTASAHLNVDDIRLVEWAAPGASGARYDTIEGTKGSGHATLTGTGPGPFADERDQDESVPQDDPKPSDILRP